MRRRTWLTGAVLGIGIIGLQQMTVGLVIVLKAELAQFLLERAWAKSLQGEKEVRPWPWADTWPVAKLVVPAHDVSLIVLAGANGRTLAFGPGSLHSEAEVGTSGTTVLTGHRDTHFRFLSKLKIGDEIFLHQSEMGPFPYRVHEIQVVDSRVAQVIPDPNLSTLVLVTCFPFDALMPGGPLRYVVIAEASDSRLSEWEGT